MPKGSQWGPVTHYWCTVAERSTRGAAAALEVEHDRVYMSRVRGGGRIGGGARPGLHVSCAQFIRDRDVAPLGWDMMDARPNDYGLPFPVHGVLINYGVALLNNAFLESLAAACAEEGRYEFLFMALPLKVARGTGSPANLIAMF